MQRYFKKTKCDSGMFHLECLSAFLIITSLLPLTSDTIHSSSTLFSAVPTQVACTGHHHTQKHWQIKMHWMTERTNYSLAFWWKLIIHPLIVTLSIRIWTLKSSSTVECFAEYSTNIQTKICRFLQTVLLELWWKKAWKKKWVASRFYPNALHILSHQQKCKKMMVCSKTKRKRVQGTFQL